jgi:GxxExxY protein
VVDVHYKDKIIHGQRIDLIAFEQVVFEIKSVRALPEAATAQVLSYLKATGLRRALLINFGAYRLASGIKRISL